MLVICMFLPLCRRPPRAFLEEGLFDPFLNIACILIFQRIEDGQEQSLVCIAIQVNKSATGIWRHLHVAGRYPQVREVSVSMPTGRRASSEFPLPRAFLA